jgi:hypothetical protein
MSSNLSENNLFNHAQRREFVSLFNRPKILSQRSILERIMRSPKKQQNVPFWGPRGSFFCATRKGGMPAVPVHHECLSLAMVEESRNFVRTVKIRANELPMLFKMLKTLKYPMREDRSSNSKFRREYENLV